MVTLAKPVYYSLPEKQNTPNVYFFGVVGLDAMVEKFMKLGLTES